MQTHNSLVFVLFGITGYILKRK